MGEVTTYCSLWKLELKDGTTHRLTDHDAVLEHDEERYHPQDAALAGVSELQSGFAIDNGDIRTRLHLPNLTGEAIRAGALDGGILSQYKMDWMTGEAKLLSKGRVGDVRFSDHDIEVEWLGQSSLLDRSTGRVFSRYCDASFGDERCGVSLVDFPSGTTCPRDLTACRDQFNNVENFRGFPYLLGDDVLQAGVSNSIHRDGSSRYT